MTEISSLQLATVGVFLALRPSGPLWGAYMSKTAFAAAFGTYKLAEIEAGRVHDSEADVDRRLCEAEEVLIAVRAPDRAGIMGKLERVAEHVCDCDYGRLDGELNACLHELVAVDADLGHVARALRVLAHRFEADEMPSVWVRFIRSAAADAEVLAEARPDA